MKSAPKKPRKPGTPAKRKPAKRAAATRARAAATRAPAKPPAARAKQPAAKRTAGKPAKRADYGRPIDGFFARQPAPLRPILVELRKMIEAAAPEATSSIKWGMPFFTVRDTMMCALGGHKSHVNLILAGPPGTYADPEGLLSGDGKTGRHLKVRSVDELPREAVRGWLRTAVELARRA